MEDHFFRIENIDEENETIDTIPLFIEKDKIIRQEVNRFFENEFEINKHYLKEKYLIDYYVNILNDPDNDSDTESDNDTKLKTESTTKIIYEVVNDYELDELKYIIKNKKVDQLKKFGLFKISYNKLYIDIDNEDNHIEFFDIIEKNKDFILENVECKENIGTLELFNKNQEELYKMMLEECDEIIKYKFTSQLFIDFSLQKPEIIHDMTKFNFDDIYRVHEKDNTFKLMTTEHVTNWSGFLLDDSVRNEIKVNDCIRVAFINKVSDHYKYCTRYVKLLLKLNDTNFLGIVTNRGCNYEWDDAVIIISTDCMTEVSGYDYKRLDTNEGFEVTGVGALVPNNKEIDLNYDLLKFYDKEKVEICIE